MINFCPHCCNRAKQEEIHTQPYVGIGWAMDKGDAEETKETYFVYKCTTCNEILVYHQLFDFEWTLLFPDISLDNSVPDDVSNIYNEAIRIKTISPNSFAVQIRRALEAICIDRGVNKNNLAANLKILCERGEIPNALAEAGDILRLIGNLGAHAANTDVHPLQAMAIDDFFKAIVEYIYVSPAKITGFNELLNDYKKNT